MKHSIETKRQISASLKGRHVSPRTEFKKGQNKSVETRIKMKYAKTREKHNRWKGGLTSLNHQIRNTVNYKQWRSNVFQRDNWTCQTCNSRGRLLEAHHIISFSDLLKKYNIQTMEHAEKCKELWNINNGITLCEDCHKLTDNYRNRHNTMKGGLYT